MQKLCGNILAAVGLSLTVNAAEPAAAAFVTVDFANVARAVKPMHAVNNGPTVKKPVDMLMFYDARTSSNMNNMFSRPTLQPQKGYYPFYAWSKLVGCGTQVLCTVREGRGEASDANTGTVFKNGNGKPVGSFRAVAGKGADGSGALIVARYSDDNNVTDIAEVAISVSGVSLAGARCHLTDSVRTYTEVPLDLGGDGTALIRMQPNSFAVVEW